MQHITDGAGLDLAMAELEPLEAPSFTESVKTGVTVVVACVVAAIGGATLAAVIAT